MVTHTRLRYSRDYLPPGLWSLLSPLLWQNWFHLPPKSSQSCYNMEYTLRVCRSCSNVTLYEPIFMVYAIHITQGDSVIKEQWYSFINHRRTHYELILLFLWPICYAEFCPMVPNIVIYLGAGARSMHSLIIMSTLYYLTLKVAHAPDTHRSWKMRNKLAAQCGCQNITRLTNIIWSALYTLRRMQKAREFDCGSYSCICFIISYLLVEVYHKVIYFLYMIDSLFVV